MTAPPGALAGLALGHVRHPGDVAEDDRGYQERPRRERGRDDAGRRGPEEDVQPPGRAHEQEADGRPLERRVVEQDGEREGGGDRAGDRPGGDQRDGYAGDEEPPAERERPPLGDVSRRDGSLRALPCVLLGVEVVVQRRPRRVQEHGGDREPEEDRKPDGEPGGRRQCGPEEDVRRGGEQVREPDERGQRRDRTTIRLRGAHRTARGTRGGLRTSSHVLRPTRVPPGSASRPARSPRPSPRRGRVRS